MSRVITAARRLIVAAKPDAFDSSEHDRAIATAREKAEHAADELASVTALHAAALDAQRVAKAAFDAEPSEANVTALLKADAAVQKQGLYVDRAKSIADAARCEFDACQLRRDEAEFAWLEARDAQFSAKLTAKVAARLEELEKLASEINAVVMDEVNAARIELQRRYELAPRIGKRMPEHMFLLTGVNNQASRHHLLLKARVSANQSLRWLEYL